MRIAIQGHSTRGKEVIQILENLGGINKNNFTGSSFNFYYYIDEYNHIKAQSISTRVKSFYYTLEEFEKEFPFKIGDKVIFKNDYLSNPTVYTITKFEFYGDKFCYLLDGSHFHYSATTLKLYQSMKEERNITLTLDKAREWYQKGGELKEIALQAFTKEELNPLPKSWEEYCKMYSSQAAQSIFIMGHPKKYIALWKLEQLRDCYRQGWKPDFSKVSSFDCIFSTGKYLAVSITTLPCFLLFPEKTIAREFLKNFESLIKEAGDLI